MIDDLQKSMISSRGDTSYQHLMIDDAPSHITYHSTFRLTTVTIVLCISTYYYGFILTNLATFSTQTILEVYGQTAAKSSIWGLIIGLPMVGGMIGSLIAPILMRHTSRKQFIIIINFITFGVLGLIQITNMYVLFVLRVIQGIIFGLYMSLVPVYVNQICPKQIVGVLGVFSQLLIVFATVVNYALGLLLTKIGVTPIVFCRIMQTYIAIPIAFQLVLLFANFVPESPNSLIRKNKNEEARQVISLFTIPSFVQQTFRQKKMEIEAEDLSEEETASSQDRIQYTKKAYLLGLQIPFMMQITGICGVVTQVNNIVDEVAPEISQYTGLLICSIQFISNLFTLPILANFGRKPLTLFGNIVLGVVDMLLGLLFIFYDWSTSGYIILVLLVIYIIVFGVSLGPVVWLYVPEIIPSKIVPIATVMNFLGASIATIFTPMIMEVNSNNAFPAFFGFGCITLVLFVINYRYMVQTKGLTTKQIAESFAKKQ